MKRNENKKSLTKKIVAGTGLALLLALVGYTGANTYAKYITSAEVQTQNATVAKWGVVVSASGVNAFSEKYSGTGLATANSSGTSVSAAGKVVAPGTTGSITFSITGSPEVASKVSIDLEIPQYVAVKDGANVVYEPIVWTLKQGTQVVDGAEKVTSKTIQEKVDGLSETYAPKANLSTTYGSYTLTWEWPIETGADEDAIAQNDIYDTFLGNNGTDASTEGITAGYTAHTNLEFNLTIEVEQIQQA